MYQIYFQVQLQYTFIFVQRSQSLKMVMGKMTEAISVKKILRLQISKSNINRPLDEKCSRDLTGDFCVNIWANDRGTQIARFRQRHLEMNSFSRGRDETVSLTISVTLHARDHFRTHIFQTKILTHKRQSCGSIMSFAKGTGFVIQDVLL